MDAATWALIGLLGVTIFGGIFYLGGRLDAESARIDVLVSQVAGLTGDLGQLRRDVGDIKRDLAELKADLTAHVERDAG